VFLLRSDSFPQLNMVGNGIFNLGIKSLQFKEFMVHSSQSKLKNLHIPPFPCLKWEPLQSPYEK
jgi:hypothetical protein